MNVKQRRIRLAPKAYRELCSIVLKRAGWRCQYCGALENLQVHHMEWRSHLGPDTLENLITLCSKCHISLHRGACDRT